MRIQIRTLYKDPIDLMVNRKVLIEKIKVWIAEIYDIPYEQQLLVFKGDILRNEKTVEDCQIRNGSVIFLAVKSRIESNDDNSEDEDFLQRENIDDSGDEGDVEAEDGEQAKNEKGNKDVGIWYALVGNEDENDERNGVADDDENECYEDCEAVEYNEDEDPLLENMEDYETVEDEIATVENMSDYNERCDETNETVEYDKRKQKDMNDIECQCDDKVFAYNNIENFEDCDNECSSIEVSDCSDYFDVEQHADHLATKSNEREANDDVPYAIANDDDSIIEVNDDFDDEDVTQTFSYIDLLQNEVDKMAENDEKRFGNLEKANNNDALFSFSDDNDNKKNAHGSETASNNRKMNYMETYYNRAFQIKLDSESVSDVSSCNECEQNKDEAGEREKTDNDYVDNIDDEVLPHLVVTKKFLFDLVDMSMIKIL